MEESTDSYSEYFADTLICKDCKFSSKRLGVWMCSRPTGLLNLATGKEDKVYRGCSIERMHDSFLGRIQCGPTGRFYEASKWKKVKLFFNKQ